MANKPKPNPNAKHTLDDVLKTLQDLVRNELAEGGAASTSATASALTEEPSDAAVASDAASDSVTDPSLTLEEAVAQLLDDTHDDLASEISPEPAPTTPPADGIVAPFDDVIDSEQTPAPKARKGKTKSAPEQTSINWDDIPILNDVVIEPAIDDTAPLPPPSRARELAVRVIAKLNIELRKAGNTPLDPVMIDRLEHLLREALEIAAAKPDHPAQN